MAELVDRVWTSTSQARNDVWLNLTSSDAILIFSANDYTKKSQTATRTILSNHLTRDLMDFLLREKKAGCLGFSKHYLNIVG